MVKILLLSMSVILLYIPMYCILASLHLVCPIPVYHDELRLTELTMSEISDYHDIDILFVGSSQSYRGFDVRQFKEAGYSSFNMGTTSQRPYQNHLLLNKYIDSLRPRLVVLAVSPVLMQVSKESTLDYLWSDFEKDKIQWELDKLRMTLNCKSWYMFNMWVYNAYRHHVYNPLMRRMGKLQPMERHIDGDEMIVGPDKYVRGGYVERQVDLTCSPEPKKTKVIEYDSVQVYYMKQCVKLLEDRNIQYILVEPPIQPSAYANWVNHSEWEQIIAAYPYLNYNEPVFLNDTIDFYDNGHMNYIGVEKFNKIFISYLKDSLQFVPNYPSELNEEICN